ncbi:MAG: redox-sensing transcriptional repressor Rex [Oscillospiraceae bacterium]|nr:redox-sensing transcriptional repressor Rex [Oscillospiraceae bacterium]
MKKAKISHNVILRLPRYLRYLEALHRGGTIRISSEELGRRMGIPASQIRQDLSCFGAFGQRGYGYRVEMLIREVSEILGISEERRAVVIGAGNLGRAIISNFPFSQYGIRLTHAFDISVDIVGQSLSGLTISHIDTLEAEFQKNRPDVAVLTMSAESAPAIADRLIAAGIRGIWNFTNEDLIVSNPHVVVENIHFSDSLLTLSYYMARGIENENSPS